MKSRRFFGAVVIGVCIAGLSVSAQTWYELYDDAIKDVSAGRWEEAASKLQRARKSGPRSGDRVLRYSNNYDHFFPEFYLGLVYLELNRPKEALEQFRLARKANIEKARNAEFRRIAEFEKRAESRILIAEAKPPVAPPPGAGKPLPTPPALPPPVSSPDKPMPSTPTVKVVDPLEAVRQQFVGVMSDARAQLKERNFTRADQLGRSARNLAEQNNMAAQRDEADRFILQVIGAAAAGLSEALKRRDGAAARREYDTLVAALPGVADQFRTRVESLEGELKSANMRREALSFQRDAMVAFLNGNYSRTLNLLDAAEKIASLTPRGYFYRACSLAATALTLLPANAERVKQLEADAQRNYRIAARGASQFRPDLQFISPKIRQMLGIK